MEAPYKWRIIFQQISDKIKTAQTLTSEPIMEPEVREWLSRGLLDPNIFDQSEVGPGGQPLGQRDRESAVLLPAAPAATEKSAFLAESFQKKVQDDQDGLDSEDESDNEEDEDKRSEEDDLGQADGDLPRRPGPRRDPSMTPPARIAGVSEGPKDRSRDRG
mmetsp:Transcript_40672/g.91438  ORF Transcript_40672/g.91438 Transcript_40672/m.91438 type:complete len:161 (+) Transcript_40672:2593-3075(+)